MPPTVSTNIGEICSEKSNGLSCVCPIFIRPNIKIKGMPQCLFCLKEGEGDAVRFTDEHIFPAALGGNLVVKDGSCDGCNHGNSKFEQALAVELTPMRMLL